MDIPKVLLHPASIQLVDKDDQGNDQNNDVSRWGFLLFPVLSRDDCLVLSHNSSAHRYKTHFMLIKDAEQKNCTGQHFVERDHARYKAQINSALA